jgi:endonuclease/exonuclease/phosphatase
MNLSTLVLGIFTIVQLNCENLFDCQHDSLKNDYEFLPTSYRHWNPHKYWCKMNHLSQSLVSCGDWKGSWSLPDIVALCEVENDSVMRDLTLRAPLRTLRYQYVMTQSPDLRGIDVALLYSPFTFSLLQWHSVRVNPIKGMRPTRDILYVSGRVFNADTLHIMVVHAPSRMGGEHFSRAFRCEVAKKINEITDSIRSTSSNPNIVILGDFNDYVGNLSLEMLSNNGLFDISANAKGLNGTKGTYKYKGEWDSLDHIFVSEPLKKYWLDCFINDADFLLCDDEKYGGKQPFRCYVGAKYHKGYSDHLPLVAHFEFK